MSKYKLSMQEGNFKNTLEFEADGLDDVVANMEIFLKGNGFFFDGILDVHTGTPETNAMHGTMVQMKYRESNFNDTITDSDQLDMEIKDGE